MALIRLRINSYKLPAQELKPQDVELAALLLDLVYLLCLQHEYGTAKSIYLFEHGLKIKRINYRNPLNVTGFLRNVSVGGAKWVLDRVLFYPEEKTKRVLENESLSQDIIKKKLENLEIAQELRKRLINDGVSPEQATQQIAVLLAEEKANLILMRPQREK